MEKKSKLEEGYALHPDWLSDEVGVLQNNSVSNHWESQPAFIIDGSFKDVGTNPQTFEIVLNEDFQKYKYICGFDDYEEEKPINTYNKIKRFLGLHYKVKERQSHVSVYRVNEDVSVEYLNREQ